MQTHEKERECRHIEALLVVHSHGKRSEVKAAEVVRDMRGRGFSDREIRSAVLAYAEFIER